MDKARQIIALVRDVIADSGRKESVGDVPVLTTNAVCKQLGITARTARFYDDVGIVKPQRRRTARLFSPAQIRRLQLARDLRGLGLDIKSIVGLLDQLDGSGSLQDKLADVSEQLSRHREDLARRADEVHQQQDMSKRLLQELGVQGPN
jgi:DNA-binding transcriptional MerR regulator